MADTKFTMVGMTSAGKTCFITAMYMKMSVGFDGFTLVTDDNTRAKLERDILALREPSGVDRFPVATDVNAIRSYRFELNYGLKKIIGFEMLDYAGGLLRSREENYSQVKQSIAESTALYIFIDGKSLCAEDREERKENVYFDCAMTLTPMIQDFADTHKGCLPPIVFVITKFDLCNRYVNNDELTYLIKELFSPAFSTNTTSYICAISLGQDISSNNYKGRFRPVNIHIPFFIGSYHEYYNRCVLMSNEIEKANRDLTSQKDERSGKMYKEMGKWWIFRNEKYIEEKRREIRDADSAIQSNNGLLKRNKELFNAFSERLEKESRHFKCFIDGAEINEFKRFVL